MYLFLPWFLILTEQKNIYDCICFGSEDHVVQRIAITNNRKIIPCPQISWNPIIKQETTSENRWMQRNKYAIKHSILSNGFYTAAALLRNPAYFPFLSHFPSPPLSLSFSWNACQKIWNISMCFPSKNTIRKSHWILTKYCSYEAVFFSWAALIDALHINSISNILLCANSLLCNIEEQ